MSRRTDFQAAITYKGQKIKGEVTVSLKIDGVRILRRDVSSVQFSTVMGYVTRNNKVPPGLSTALTDEAKNIIDIFGDCEVYKKNFLHTNSILERNNPKPNCIDKEHIYPLDFGGDNHYVTERLFICVLTDPCPEQIQSIMEEAVENGYEGLVLRTPNSWYRVKPNATADVYITGYFEQLDKNKKPKGILGGFTTNYGKVTAFTRETRELFWDNPQQYVGKLMNCQYKERYHTGKFRYAVKFLNLVTDKDHESFDTKPPEK